MKPSDYGSKKLELILSLVGHTDVIIDFDWRHQTESAGSCEIVSWSKDQTLRVWRVDKQFIEMNVENFDYEPECDIQTSGDRLLPVDESIQNSETISAETKLSQTSPRFSPPGKRLDAPPISKDQVQAIAQPDLDDKENVGEGEEEDDSSMNSLATTNELRQEFNLINKNIPNIEFEELNSLRRVCLVIARAKNVTCRLRIALPPSYPHDECPTFTIIDSNQYGLADSGLTADAREKLINTLNETAKIQLARSRNCIEPCLRKFIAALQKITSHSSYRRRGLASSMGQTSSFDYKEDPITLSAQRDHSVPFPATSGARFCGNLLVCFGRPMLSTMNNSRSTSGVGDDTTSFSVETPRSMAQLSAQLDNMRRQGSYNLSHISVSYFYYGAMRRAELHSRTSSSNRDSSTSGIGSTTRSSSSFSSKYLSNRGRASTQPMLAKNFKCGPVLVYDVSNMLGGISKELAEDYVFDKDVIKMCRRNAEISAVYNRRDLVQIWSLAELSSEGVLRSYMPNSLQKNPNNGDNLALNFMNSGDSDFGDRPWTMHPFGSKLIQSLIDHYVYNCHDVQTAAMLVWTFSSPRACVQSQNTHQLRMNSTSLMNGSNIAAPNSGSSRNVKTYSEALSKGANSSVNANLSQTISSATSAANGSSTLTGSSSTDRQNLANIYSNDALSDEWNFVNGPEPHLYSNSWSNSTNINETDTHWAENCPDGVSGAGTHDTQAVSINDYKNLALQSLSADGVELRCFPKLNILSPDRSLQNDLIMHIYAELLYRLNLLNQRAMVLKNIGSNSAYSEIFGDKQTSISDAPQDRIPNLSIQCFNSACRKQCRSVQCSDCKKYSFNCSICRLPVKGSCSICMNCLHGGHVNHFSVWFETHDFCPTGCGCKCPTMPQGY